MVFNVTSLNFLVFVLTFFTVFELTVIYFMYGSIETREQERQKARELKLMGGEV